jgi:beta-glucosidase
VVDIYRRRYQSTQGGSIGITLNQDWGEPFDSEKKEDIDAAERRNIFQKAWFADPIYFGNYPKEMVARVGIRLPTFSTKEKKILVGSTDFLGLNHYTASYIRNCPDESSKGGDIGVLCTMDENTVYSPYNASGHLIGAPAASAWLHVAPWAFFSMLIWNSRRYSNPLVYITENGVDVPGVGSF